MKHMCNQPRFWKRPTTFLILTTSMAVLLMSPGGLEAQGLPTHDAHQTTQHQNLSGQVTTHDSAQTTQHNELKQKIDNLSRGVDLSGLPPTWDKTLPANDTSDPCNSSRFKCVMMGGAAVLDRETGLVWERSPDAILRNWFDAQRHCMRSTVGNRSGWRLPTIQEIASLTDPSLFVSHFRLSDVLPHGHPFSNVDGNYWSATTTSLASGLAYDWASSTPDLGVTPPAKSLSFPVWCVRGGQGVDPQ